MSIDSFSFLVWCHNDPQPDTVHLRVVSVSTGEDIQFKKGSFLLRVTVDTDTSIVRCLIRHIASGKETHVQGGPNLRAFIKANLLKEGKNE
jgi:hypothetical protein